MTIIAIDENGIKYNSLEMNKDIAINKLFFCPNCKEKLMYVDSVVRVKHFRHYGLNNCSTEPDTEQHMLFKKQIYEHYINRGFKCEYEVKIGDRIADIYMEGENAKIVVECQISPISPEELIIRDKNYTNLGYETIWLLHLSTYAKYLNITDVIKTSGRKYAVVSLKRVERERTNYRNIRIRYFDGNEILNFQFSNRVVDWGNDSKKKFKEKSYYKAEKLLWLGLITDNMGKHIDGDKVLGRMIELQQADVDKDKDTKEIK